MNEGILNIYFVVKYWVLLEFFFMFFGFLFFVRGSNCWGSVNKYLLMLVIYFDV